MIVVAQFAATLTDDTGAPLLLVKGGSSLELRRGIPDSRTSKDFDTVARRDIELIHEQLADAARRGGKDSLQSSPPPKKSMFLVCRSSRADSPPS